MKTSKELAKTVMEKIEQTNQRRKRTKNILIKTGIGCAVIALLLPVSSKLLNPKENKNAEPIQSVSSPYSDESTDNLEDSEPLQSNS